MGVGLFWVRSFWSAMKALSFMDASRCAGSHPHDGESITEAEALQIKEDVLADLLRNKIVADWVD